MRIWLCFLHKGCSYLLIRSCSTHQNFLYDISASPLAAGGHIDLGALMQILAAEFLISLLSGGGCWRWGWGDVRAESCRVAFQRLKKETLGVKLWLQDLCCCKPRCEWSRAQTAASVNGNHVWNVKLSTCRGYRVPLLRRLGQWLHQHAGVSKRALREHPTLGTSANFSNSKRSAFFSIYIPV